MEVGVHIAFIGGLLSFLSPCVLPLAPPYLAYLGGTTLDQISGESEEVDPAVRLRVFLSAVCFVLGLGAVFVGLGLGAATAGNILLDNKAWLATVSGFFIYGFGLHFIGFRQAPVIFFGTVFLMGLLLWSVSFDPLADAIDLLPYVAALAALSAAAYFSGQERLSLLTREARFEGPAQAGSYGTSFVMGTAFAFGWTPCIGPILAAILALAAQEGSVWGGGAMLAVYALGLGVPFLVAALFIGPFLRWAKGFRRHLGKVEAGMGTLLVAVGAMMITGDFERLAYWLLEAFPVLATIG
ncbi:MAG: cytochrome c biogenesis protein CcdA [Pseudomonadota bacterium]